MATDYLLRLFEWTRQLQNAIAVKREAGAFPEAREEIEKACLRATGLSFDLIRRYSPEALLELMQYGADACQKSIFIAELLIEYAKICESEGKTVHEIASTLQAYCLISGSIGVLNQEEKKAYHSKLDILAKKLSNFKDNPYIKQKLTSRPNPRSEDMS